MPVKFSGYDTSESDWIEGLLADSNTIVAVDGYSSGGVDYLLIATDSGVCAISRTMNRVAEG